MKSELTEGFASTNSVDWSKPQLLRQINYNYIVMSTGKSEQDTFEGVVVYAKQIYKEGGYAKKWAKETFYPLPPNQIVKLQND